MNNINIFLTQMMSNAVPENNIASTYFPTMLVYPSQPFSQSYFRPQPIKQNLQEIQQRIPLNKTIKPKTFMIYTLGINLNRLFLNSSSFP